MGSEEVVKGSLSHQHLDDWHKPSLGWRQHLGAWNLLERHAVWAGVGVLNCILGGS